MNFIILLIIQFTENVVCLYLNSCLNVDSSTINPYRLKRAPTEYTRWQADFTPTEEFIVKVLEEDSPVPNSQVAPVDIASMVPENDAERLRNGQGPGNADIAETEIDPNIDLIVNPFPKSNVDDNDNVPVPVYSNNKIISQKTYKGKVDTKYPKVKYMSVRSENQDSLLGSRFLSKLDSPVQQFAPIDSALPQEPLLKFKPLDSDFKYVHQLATRTSPKSDIIAPMRTFNMEKFSPLRTSITESFPLRTIATDSFEYIHPIRSTTAESPSRKLKKLFNMRTGTTKSITVKEFKAFVDEDEDEDDNSMEVFTTMKASDNKSKKYIKNIESEKIEDECEETELDVTEDSTESTNFTILEKFVGEVTRPTISDFPRQRNSRRHQTNCTLRNQRNYDGSPRTLYEIVMQMKKWAENSPLAKWVDITNGNHTIMENPIYMMMVDDLSEGQVASAKETVLIVAGILGKDHHAVAAAMSLLQQIIEKSASHSDLLRKYRFWIIPVLNPDGYDYSMTFPLRRHWFKNLRQTWNTGKDETGCQAFGVNCTTQTCYGVNLDRNFEYQWIPTKELQAEHPCGSLYAGPRQLSEVETRSFTRYLDKKHIHAFIAYKEGDILGVLYPYSHTKKKRPLDNFYRVRSLRAATAASVAGGRTYVYGQTSEYLPLYAGGIEDWVDGHLGIDNTYCIMMMRRTDDRDDKSLLERVAHEAFAATHALLFPSDYDQIHLPVAMRSRNAGKVTTTEYTGFITLVILLGNGGHTIWSCDLSKILSSFLCTVYSILFYGIFSKHFFV